MSSDAESLHGRVADASDPDKLRAAVEWAFDYRGDVTIARRSSQALLEGYVFDRRAEGDDVLVRMIKREDGRRVVVPLSDIARIEFTGKDTASGKSFETWVRKYLEKKAAGERAIIESETLDG